MSKIIESVITLREELMKHGEVYDGFRASILSAIRESGMCVEEEPLADQILARLIGEEK